MGVCVGSYRVNLTGGSGQLRLGWPEMGARPIRNFFLFREDGEEVDICVMGSSEVVTVTRGGFEMLTWLGTGNNSENVFLFFLISSLTVLIVSCRESVIS